MNLSIFDLRPTTFLFLANHPLPPDLPSPSQSRYREKAALSETGTDCETFAPRPLIVDRVHVQPRSSPAQWTRINLLASERDAWLTATGLKMARETRRVLSCIRTREASLGIRCRGAEQRETRLRFGDSRLRNREERTATLIDFANCAAREAKRHVTLATGERLRFQAGRVSVDAHRGSP